MFFVNNTSLTRVKIIKDTGMTAILGTIVDLNKPVSIDRIWSNDKELFLPLSSA